MIFSCELSWPNLGAQSLLSGMKQAIPDKRMRSSPKGRMQKEAERAR